MAMTCLNNRKNDSFIFSTIEELVPLDHKVRELEEAIDWTFIYPLVKPLYKPFGRPSIDPVVLFKMLFRTFKLFFFIFKLWFMMDSEKNRFRVLLLGMID